ncbi:MAG: hypothetical protein PHI12_12205 [Dehalococcoidales bacterium]|nr:hypothetical protein [Dehalococcoidales bacterium]
MASQEKVLRELANQTGSVSQQELAEILKEKQGGFKSQLDLFEKRQWATQDEDKKWTITELGREELAKMVQEPVNSEEVQVASANMTPFQQFIECGQSAGAVGKDAFFIAVANYVFQGGDYKDMNWVTEALSGMGIRADVLERWLRFWSGKSFVSNKITDKQINKVKDTGLSTEEKQKKAEEEVRDYDLDPDDKPIKVGADLGTLTYKDALELSKVRAISKARAGASAGGNGASNKSLPEQIKDWIGAIDEMRGNSGQAPPKGYLVKPGPDGNMMVEVVENTGIPMIIPQAQAAAPKKEIWVWKDGQLIPWEADKPLVFSAPPPVNPTPPPAPKRFMVDSATGQVSEITGDLPIIIRPPPPPPAVNPANAKESVSVTIEQADGSKQRVSSDSIDLYLRLEDFKDRRRREEESHQIKVDISNGFKDLLGKVTKAAERMANKPADGGGS